MKSFVCDPAAAILRDNNNSSQTPSRRHLIADTPSPRFLHSAAAHALPGARRRHHCTYATPASNLSRADFSAIHPRWHLQPLSRSTDSQPSCKSKFSASSSHTRRSTSFRARRSGVASTFPVIDSSSSASDTVYSLPVPRAAHNTMPVLATTS